jgi:hypothetical protein
VILDLEPMRRGEEECAAALRLLRRMRKAYGLWFFDLEVVDAWYANGPFLKTVVEELGWPVAAALKPARRDLYQEALALLWIKIIAFTLFHAFAIGHGKLFRLGKVTLQELRKRIYCSLLCGWPIRCFSG